MKKILALTSALLMFACTQKMASSGGGATCQPYASSGQSIGASNVIPITMGCGYVNEPCVAVKVCVPGSTTNCQIIDHILLDTGSYGLRLFSCTLSLSLTQQTGAVSKTATATLNSSSLTGVSSTTTLVAGQTITGTGIPAGTTVSSFNSTTVFMSKQATANFTGSFSFTGNVAECVHYADGTSDWGPVKLADVYLGGKKASNTPIQIVDSTYGSVPGSCGTPEVSPQSAGFNGILGVGLIQYDCPSCNAGTNLTGYYNCASGGCAGYYAPNSVQTTNPVTLLSSTYNNGVVLSVADVPSNFGANGITGQMILGVDTVAGVPNPASPCDPTSADCGNSATGTSPHAASANLVFNTTFPATGTDAHIFTNSFVDSGSNLWDFANNYMNSPVTVCTDGFYCPASSVTLGVKPTGGTSVSFTLINADNANYSLSSFKTLGAYFDSANDSFDWGMPFYYGRNVFHVISGQTGAGTTGPAWAW